MIITESFYLKTLTSKCNKKYLRLRSDPRMGPTDTFTFKPYLYFTLYTLCQCSWTVHIGVKHYKGGNIKLGGKQCTRGKTLHWGKHYLSSLLSTVREQFTLSSSTRLHTREEQSKRSILPCIIYIQHRAKLTFKTSRPLLVAFYQ